MPRLLPPTPVAQRSAHGDVVRIDPATLAVAGSIAAGDGPDPAGAAAVAHLVRSGLATVEPGDGAPVLERRFEQMVQVLSDAHTIAHVQRFAGHRTTTATALAGADGGVVVEHDAAGTCLLTGVEPSRMACAVAGLVGFDAAPNDATPHRAGHFGEVLDGFLAHLVTGDAPGAAGVLARAAHLHPSQLTLLLGLVDGTCTSWRIVTRRSTLTVVDAGRRGVWRAGTTEPHGHEHGFAPATRTEVAHALAGLFPAAPPPARQRAGSTAQRCAA